MIKLGRGLIDREKERDGEILRGGNKEVYKVRGLFERGKEIKIDRLGREDGCVIGRGGEFGSTRFGIGRRVATPTWLSSV